MTDIVQIPHGGYKSNAEFTPQATLQQLILSLDAYSVFAISLMPIVGKENMKLMIVDQHTLFREGMISLVKDQADIEVVGNGSSEADMVSQALICKPDIIVMDENLFLGQGKGMMNFILSKQPEISFLILSPDEDSDLMLDAIRNGAKGYLPKNVSRSVLLKSLQAIQRGEIALSRSMTAEIALELHRMSKVTLKNPDDTITALTYRELQVLRLLVNEASNSEIARQLFISDNTVRVHVHRILEKLRARNRREAARFAQRLGIENK